MTLTKIQVESLKKILKDPAYEVMLQVVAGVIDRWKDEPVKADTEFETIWRTATRESKVAGVKELFEIFERGGLE